MHHFFVKIDRMDGGRGSSPTGLRLLALGYPGSVIEGGLRIGQPLSDFDGLEWKVYSDY